MTMDQRDFRTDHEYSSQDRRRLKHWQGVSLLLMLYDAVAVNAAYFLALWLRFDCRFTEIPGDYLRPFLGFAPAYTVLCLVIFWRLHLYRSIWRFASYAELVRTLIASILTSGIHLFAITMFFRRMPVTYFVFGGILQFLFVIGVRFSYRLVLLMRDSRSREEERPVKRVMLIGAGSAGRMILRDINKAPEIGERVVCIIDDNPNKWQREIDNVPIVGGRDSILEAVEEFEVEKIYLAVPSASPAQRRDILNICQETDCELKNLPGMYQLILGQVSVSAMKDVSVEDLLGREPIKADMKEVYDFINGRTVLVTGGGGSIGSELCRQIAAHSPRQLIIFDVYENNAYDIQLELREKYPDLDLQVLIGSVRDSRRMFEVFHKYRPQIVYHAAAHKHVPLMEDSPCEAIKNNAIGTYKTAYAAMVHGCERFVLISTDKAVNPTNIMGASKRLCEMIIQSFDAMIKAGRAAEIPELFTHEEKTLARIHRNEVELHSVKTEFVAVRFGNVLGSNGSVIPIFKKQIAQGGPVTVTHPDIIRYFMTIPEAVSLVMLAGTYAHGGEIFVLDMGSPVKIETLARNLIRLSGFRPDVDIQIAYTGLRPGEKLYEEKLMAEEGLKRTDNAMIHIGRPIPFEVETFLKQLDDLMYAAYANEEDQIRGLVEEVVTTYHPEKGDEGAEKDTTYLKLVKTKEESAESAAAGPAEAALQETGSKEAEGDSLAVRKSGEKGSGDTNKAPAYVKLAAGVDN